MHQSWYHKWFAPAQKPELESARSHMDEGNPEVQFGRGLKYSLGKGTGQDYVQAAEWYHKAAAQNHLLAQFNLGVMYASGQGVPRDDAVALMWMQKAASQGDAAAQFNLGGRFTRTSLDKLQADPLESQIEAYKWLKLASVQGYRGSAAACERMTVAMSFDSVAEGNRRVTEFAALTPAGSSVELTPEAPK